MGDGWILDPVRGKTPVQDQIQEEKSAAQAVPVPRGKLFAVSFVYRI
jgi:hypothetical protein